MLLPHTDVIWIYSLSINDRSEKNWLNIHNILKNQFTDKFKRIESAIFSKDDIYWTKLKEKLEALKNNQQLNLNIHL